ncbi:histidine phosphatase family protein [Prauserella marina]|uniref:Broad specificity phosphatase PhoE n=1 Tax=Prauserella marina TaxID=530584 RepID=A0A222VMS8_9PSEU|nr:histidine phosphatase family protein [Prauserella marina]ASR35162.1 histidine phosphatase family protein [Prauserella marina]PWV85075.1 broad specificity phosphatase PhoE [Prauserella marina]SDC05361.1 Broad specificity phosphatase PhoE [Prauserella marina]
MGAIYLVRHGQASFGAADYDVLSATGERQAGVVGEELGRRGVTLAHALSGTLSRQVATAVTALAGFAPHAVLRRDERWNEYDFTDVAAAHGDGAAQNARDPRAYQASLDAALAAWVRAGEHGGAKETWPGFVTRVTSALDELVADLGKGEQAVVFTSGGVIATVCGLLTGGAEHGLLRLNRVAVNTGITKIVTGRSGTTLLSFNEHGHIDAAASGLLSYR